MAAPGRGGSRGTVTLRPHQEGPRPSAAGRGDVRPLAVGRPVLREARREGARSGRRALLGDTPACVISRADGATQEEEPPSTKGVPTAAPGWAGCRPPGTGTPRQRRSRHTLRMAGRLRPAGPSHQPPARGEPARLGLPRDGQLRATWLKGPEAPQNTNDIQFALTEHFGKGCWLRPAKGRSLMTADRSPEMPSGAADTVPAWCCGSPRPQGSRRRRQHRHHLHPLRG